MRALFWKGVWAGPAARAGLQLGRAGSSTGRRPGSKQVTSVVAAGPPASRATLRAARRPVYASYRPRIAPLRRSAARMGPTRRRLRSRGGSHARAARWLSVRTDAVPPSLTGVSESCRPSHGCGCDVRAWRGPGGRSFEYISDYVNIYGLKIWQAPHARAAHTARAARAATLCYPRPARRPLCRPALPAASAGMSTACRWRPGVVHGPALCKSRL